MCGRFAQQRPDGRAGRPVRRRAARRRPRAATSTWPRPTRRRSSSSAATGGRSRPTAGAWSRSGPRTRAVAREADQRPGRDRRDEPGLRRQLPPPPLHRPGRRLLRVAARRVGPPAVLHPSAGRAAAGPRRPVVGLARPGDRRRPADVHDRDHDAERADRPAPRPDAGGPRAGRPGRAGSTPTSPTSASSTACSGPSPGDAIEIVPVAAARERRPQRRSGAHRPARGRPDPAAQVPAGSQPQRRRRPPPGPSAGSAPGVERGGELPDRPGEDAVRVVGRCPEHDRAAPSRTAARVVGRRARRARPRRRPPPRSDVHGARVERLGDDDHRRTAEVAQRELDVLAIEGRRTPSVHPGRIRLASPAPRRRRGRSGRRLLGALARDDRRRVRRRRGALRRGRSRSGRGRGGSRPRRVLPDPADELDVMVERRGGCRDPGRQAGHRGRTIVRSAGRGRASR